MGIRILATGLAAMMAMPARSLAAEPPPVPAAERVLGGALLSALEGYAEDAEALKQALREAGDEQAFFGERLAGTFPRPNPEQEALIAGLRRHLRTLDPDTIFFVPEGHPFYDSQRYAYTLSLFDRQGRDRPLMFVMDAAEPDFRVAGTIIHEHMHQKQVNLPEMVRRLEGATGIPRRFLYPAALRFQEGNAQRLTKLWLGVILAAKDDPFGRRLRRWLEEAIALEPESDPDGGDGKPALPREGLDDHALLGWLEELTVQRHAYWSEVESARSFPEVRSSGAPDVSIAMRGDLRPLFESWSPSKRRALAILGRHARSHPDYPRPLAKKLGEGIALIVDPADPLGAEYAESLAARLEAALGAGSDGGRTGLSDRLR